MSDSSIKCLSVSGTTFLHNWLFSQAALLHLSSDCSLTSSNCQAWTGGYFLSQIAKPGLHWEMRKCLLSFPHPAPGSFRAALNTLPSPSMEQGHECHVSMHIIVAFPDKTFFKAKPSLVRSGWLAALQLVPLMGLRGSLQQVRVTEQQAQWYAPLEHGVPVLKSWNSFDFPRDALLCDLWL